jgi:hypothetical protein
VLVLSRQRFENLKRAGGIGQDIEREGISA